MPSRRLLLVGALATIAVAAGVVAQGDALARAKPAKAGTWKLVDRTYFTTDVAYRAALVNTSTGSFLVLPPPTSVAALPDTPPAEPIAPPPGAKLLAPGTYDVETVMFGDASVPTLLTLLVDTSSGLAWFHKGGTWHSFQLD